MLQTFADQAVIAIENARLFNETQEALERQTATADILKVIASSPSDVQPVFEAIVGSAQPAVRSLAAATDYTLKDDKLCCNATAASISALRCRSRSHDVSSCPIEPRRTGPRGATCSNGRIIQIPDVAAPNTPEFHAQKSPQRVAFEPSPACRLSREEQAHRHDHRYRAASRIRFADKQIALLQTFADQAVIAIENARLFDEVQAKTRDLTEALTYQTGSANILSVIASSPTDVRPVLKAIVESACELCEAYDAVVRLKDRRRPCASARITGRYRSGCEKWPINRELDRRTRVHRQETGACARHAVRRR